MYFSIDKDTKWLFAFFLILSYFVSLSLSDPRFPVANLTCGNSKTTTGCKELYMNFVNVMEHLDELVCVQKWGSYSVQFPSPPMYGLAQCHRQLSIEDCELCFAKARTKLARCLPVPRGRIVLQGCYVRYDNYDFFSETVNKEFDFWDCGASNKLWKGKEVEEFSENVEAMVLQLTEEAVNSGGFGAVEEIKGLHKAYALGQCRNTLNSTGCKVCLENAWREVKKCLPSAAEGRGIFAGCFLRYSSTKFFGKLEELKGDDHWTSKTFVILVLVGVGLILLSLLGSWVGYHQISLIKKAKRRFTRIPTSLNESDLNYSYEALERATEFFGASNKLGQGGSSSVYKGILPNGETVAIKRLLFNTRPWVDDFFNEVNLISKVRHTNLVRLLGCSIEGPESLLVYEYVPNKTLDQIIFDKKNAKTVNWRRRFNIILGIAEGLAHLHGGCEAKIFHRDIKSSNILLDENMTPKIADFGLARCLPAGKSHLSTGIAGTLGYMAPEYLLRGQLTEKADVYGFGVLALEIACARKNNTFTLDSESVLQNVWENYTEGNITRAIGSSSNIDDFEHEEASKVLHLGLLCTQGSAELRPSMLKVVELLTTQEALVPLPKQPPFSNASFLAPTEYTSCST